MADLTSLLNPAPSADEVTQEAPGTDHDASHDGKKLPDLPPVKIGAPNLQPSVKSPLDTLADAATSSTPLLSPTNPNGTPFMTLGAYRQSTGPPSSRPTSSRITPPLSFDKPYAQAPTSPAFSPGLQQYHHPTSSEVRARRASGTAENSVVPLPPLRSALPDTDSPEGTDQLGPLLPAEPALPMLPGIDVAAALVEEPSNEAQPDKVPVTSQISQPSPPGVSAIAKESSLRASQSDQAQVKTETYDMTPDLRSTSPQPPHLAPKPSSEPQQGIGLSTPTTDMKPKASPAPSTASIKDGMLKPQPGPSRKRPAPKKGTATAVKPAAKKRKVEKPVESIEKSSPLAHSGTPSSRRASKTPAPKFRKQESATPQRSSSVANEDDEDDEDGVFCICRGPDDHTWMIACDGPCEDWFHGRCINMTEKEGELIEKYYCPNCFEAGKGETLWKRMCRLEGCRRPARINGTSRSKYCSDEHGCEFMKRLALQEEAEGRTLIPGVTPVPDIAAKKGRQTNNSFANVDLNTDIVVPAPAPVSDFSQQSGTKETHETGGNEYQSQLRGGILRPGELKALVSEVKDISDFRKLGDGVLNPTPTAAKGGTSDIKMEDAAAPEPITMSSQIPFTPGESDELQTLASKKDELRNRKKLLDDRDIFLALVRERAKGALDELKKKEHVKDICGFDARLVWLDEEFDIWRTSPEGVKALGDRKLGAPTTLIPTQVAPQANGEPQQQPHIPIATATVNGDGPAPSGGAEQQDTSEELGKGICKKRKCERHRNWFKIQQQEVGFAKDEVRQGMRKLDEEEKALRDRARIRWLEGGEEEL
ncbi:MAG: hypothetical protein Q9197_004026 [Variospora fuerteventurae]